MKINLLLLPFLLAFILLDNCGCAPSASVVQTAIAQTQSVFTDTPESTPTVIGTPTPEPMPTIVPTNTPSIKQLTSINKSITVSNCSKFSIQDIEFSRRVLPPNTSGYYTYYEAKDPGSTFMDIIVNVTNLDTIAKTAEDLVSISIIYDNSYNYSSSPIVVDSNGDFTYSLINSIQPLLSQTAHYLITVPNQVEYSSKSLIIIITSCDQEYHYKYH